MTVVKKHPRTKVLKVLSCHVHSACLQLQQLPLAQLARQLLLCPLRCFLTLALASLLLLLWALHHQQAWQQQQPCQPTLLCQLEQLSVPGRAACWSPGQLAQAQQLLPAVSAQVQRVLRTQQHRLLLVVVLLLEWHSGSLLLPCQRPEQLQEVQLLLALLLVLQKALRQLLEQAAGLVVVVLLVPLQEVVPRAKAGQEGAAALAVRLAVLVVGLVPASQARQLVVVVLLLRPVPAKLGTWALAGLLAAAAAA
jgi:hypothetical protein